MKIDTPLWKPISEWHEDDGPCFLTQFPVCEPYGCGSPLDDDWDGYYTHFIPMSILQPLLCDGRGMPWVTEPLQPDYKQMYESCKFNLESIRKMMVRDAERMINPPISVQNFDFKEMYEKQYDTVMRMSSETLIERLRRWWNDRKVM